MEPEHISAYSLILEEGTCLYEQYKQGDLAGWKLPSEEEERAMYDETGRKLQKAGYERYEISNYAKQGYECRHNIGYWKRIDYLGLGLGASSLLSNVRFQNESDLTVYMKQWSVYGALLQKEVDVLSEKEQMEEFMFLGLRLTKGIQIAEFEVIFHKSFDSVYGKIVEQLLAKKLLIREKERIYLSSYGRDISNQVLARNNFV